MILITFPRSCVNLISNRSFIKPSFGINSPETIFQVFSGMVLIIDLCWVSFPSITLEDRFCTLMTILSGHQILVISPSFASEQKTRRLLHYEPLEFYGLPNQLHHQSDPPGRALQVKPSCSPLTMWALRYSWRWKYPSSNVHKSVLLSIYSTSLFLKAFFSVILFLLQMYFKLIL